MLKFGMVRVPLAWIRLPAMKKSKHLVWLLRAVAVIVTVGSIFIFAPWQAAWAYLRPLPDTVQEEVDHAIAYDLAGIIVYVGGPGQAAEFATAGWHDRDNRIPAYPRALFKIASISKLYNAAAVAKLVAAGRLSLDGTVAGYFPDLAGRIENSNQITLRMLVQHRSGIPDFTRLTPNYWQHPPDTRQEQIELVLDMPASFPPGEDYEYSNTNYALIVELMDRTLGYSHHQFIREEILQPLGLTRTFRSIHEVDMGGVMSGYHVGVADDLKSVDYGQMLATAEDVGLFLRALNDGSLFTRREREIYASIYVYEHTGLVPGYASFARYYPDIDKVVVQFVNTTNFQGNTWLVSEVVFDRIGRILHEHPGGA